MCAQRVAQDFDRTLIRASTIMLGFLALGNPANAVETAASPIIPVAAVRATNECFSATVRVLGFFVPRVESVVRMDADGSRITAVLVGEGDVVTEGQIMVRLARPTYDVAGVPGEPAMRGSVVTGEAPPRAGPGELALRGSPSPPGSPPVASSSTGVIRAPSNGIVLESEASVGTTASLLGEPLFRIAVDNEFEVEVEVPGIHVPILAPGQTARVEIEAGRELSGHIRLVYTEINSTTQLGRARITVDGDSSLLAGRFVRATIDARRSCGISVPRSAISHRTTGPYVQVVHSGLIESRIVKVGLHSDLNTEIEEGLADGDVVVANAGTSLRDGDKVRPLFRDKAD